MLLLGYSKKKYMFTWAYRNSLWKIHAYIYLKAILRFLLVSNELTRDKKLLAVNL